jgi:hypothetical protein
MPEKEENKSPDDGIRPGAIGIEAERPKRWCVILDGVESEIETFESFAIKFSILASVPVSKVKHIMKRLPATLWSGRGRAKALNLLELVKEAGGKGRMVEDDSPEEDRRSGSQAGYSSQKSVCRKCGFPLKKNDMFCGFCMTPLQEIERKEHGVQAPEYKSSVPAYRYLFFVLVALVALILFIVLR